MKTALRLTIAACGLAIFNLSAASTIQFSASSYAVTEGTAQALILVQRTSDLGTVVSVDLATTTNGTATAGADYVEVSTNLTFLANETNKPIAVPILNDGLIEGIETFRVILTNASSGAILGAVTNATVRITDNDKGLQLELASYSVNEDAGAITVRVVRRDDGDFPVSVDYATTNLTAVAGEDYLDASGTLTFAPGDRLQKITVTLLNDAVRESSKTFRLTLSNPSGGAVLGTPVAATVTITDTDDIVQLPAASFTVREDAAFARIAVARGESALAGTVGVATANGSAIAGQDYTAVTNTLSFAPGERLKFIDVPLLNDGQKETSETFRIVLSNPTGGAVLGTTRTMTVTILDNDPGVGFERSTNSVWESQPGMTLNVIRGNDGWLGPFTVDYQTVDGTALAGVDYQASSGTLSFGANEMVKSVPVNLIRDPAPEATKYFTVTLSNLTGQVAMGRSTSRVTILDAPQGKVNLAQLPVKSEIRNVGGCIEVVWPGSAELSRADSIIGPWEQLGVSGGPLLTSPDLPGAFYRLRSPRSARVYVPSGYDGQTPMPLVLVLHGYNESIVIPYTLNYFRMEPLAEARGFLVCHPEGTVDPINALFWNATEACCNYYGSEVDDSAYLRALIEELARQYAVDRKRIYVMGQSNGGFMSHRMGCDHADLIAGIASASGVTFLDPNTPRPSQPVNVLQIHGTADEAVPYAGGTLMAGLPVVALVPGAVATVRPGLRSMAARDPSGRHNRRWIWRAPSRASTPPCCATPTRPRVAPWSCGPSTAEATT